ncbi:MAG: GHKL domain-containing protein [Eubacteriales bacterium]|nr:GHKL domain-containing protein [Eubacteriales bacterium]
MAYFLLAKFLSPLILIGAFAAGLLLLWLFQKLILHFAERRFEARLANILEQHTQELDASYRQLRSWKHDLKNHFQMLRAYGELGQTDKLQNYLDELAEDLESIDAGIRSQHLLIDALLNAKVQIAKSKDIKVSAEAVLPPKLPFPDLVLCVIIGNLLDNAIESAAEVDNPEDRFIRIYFHEMKQQVYFYVANSYQGQRTRLGSVYRSHKGGPNHGFGLLRIDRMVKRYGGYLKRADEEGVFATEILLPYPKANPTASNNSKTLD